MIDVSLWVWGVLHGFMCLSTCVQQVFVLVSLLMLSKKFKSNTRKIYFGSWYQRFQYMVVSSHWECIVKYNCWPDSFILRWKRGRKFPFCNSPQNSLETHKGNKEPGQKARCIKPNESSSCFLIMKNSNSLSSYIVMCGYLVIKMLENDVSVVH